MGMNHTRVIQSLGRCWLSTRAGQGRAHQDLAQAYRHRIVSNKPLIMKANATA